MKFMVQILWFQKMDNSKILEINSRTGYKNLDKKMKDILVEGQLQLTLDKLFPPKNKQKKETHFIEI